ncbi:MAG: NAD(P)-binding protein [Myxococcota bacterium]|nr:NAD(P)-binding protein [Myxococcota bacterium]
MIPAKISSKTPDPQSFDAIVIGSGIGGLTAAAILSKMNNMSVLVLERHYEIGGLTHVFSRGSYEWEVGVHYIGGMQPRELRRKILEYITDGALTLRKMQSPFERFIYPGIDFSVPDDPKAYRQQLINRFPDHAQEIRRYFKDVHAVRQWFVRDFLASFLPGFVSAPLHGINHLTRRTQQIALSTTAEYMAQHVTNQALSRLLTSQWGDYGAPPQQSCFGIHAVVVSHYINGGFFPDGASNRIASAIEHVIEANGGMILVNREVTEILTENSRAIGVKVMDKRNLNPVEVAYRAPIIISNAGAENTYRHLLGMSDDHPILARIDQLGHGTSAVAVYLGLKASPTKLNVSGENYWICSELEIPSIKQQTEALLDGRPRRCYLSFPSLRGGKVRYHTAIIIALAEYDAFQHWADKSWRKRDRSYQALKAKIMDALIDLADRHVPGLRDMIDYKELSTPLSMEHFTRRPKGMMYGHTPGSQIFGKGRISAKTTIKGLFLSGADACTMGVTGAMMGGVAAASAANGPLGLFKVVASARMAARRRKKKPKPSMAIPPQDLAVNGDKVRARLTAKVQLTESIIEANFEIDRPVSYRPGQYARIMYSAQDYGSFSIVRLVDCSIRFIIDTKFGGAYADFFNQLQPGDGTVLRLPLGEFTLAQSRHRKVFISTGTGIAPQLSMLSYLATHHPRETVDVYFGCRFVKDDFATRYLEALGTDLDIQRHICLSRETGQGLIHGRVTHAMTTLGGDFGDVDFYISGNPKMVHDVEAILITKGASNIYAEHF